MAHWNVLTLMHFLAVCVLHRAACFGFFEILCSVVARKTMAEAGQHVTIDMPDDKDSPTQKEDNLTASAPSRPSLTFEIQNTFWRRICSEKTTAKLVKYTFSIPLTTAVLVLLVLSVVLNIAGFDEWQPALYLTYKLLLTTVCVLWSILWMLYINVEAAKEAIRSFVFWVKTISAIQLAILHMLLAYYIDFWEHGDDALNGFRALTDVILAMCIINSVIIFSCADGLYLDRKYKVGVGVFMTIGSGLYVMYVMFNAPDIDETVINIGSLISYSLYGGYSSAAQILCLFLAKSTFFLFLNPGKCINLSGDAPLLVWK